MKKVLEGELLSLAHRVLQLKDKEIDSLFKESKELYEKLLILKFYQDHLEEGRIKDVSPERLNDALATLTISDLSTPAVESSDRHQMPMDLIEEDYPKVAEVEKEAISTLDSELVAEQINKIAPVTNEPSPIEAYRVNYDEPFITDVYIDESTTEEDDALLHNYLDQHEAMLKQVEEREIMEQSHPVQPVDEVVFNDVEDDDIEVSTVFEEKEEIVKEEISAIEQAPVVEESIFGTSTLETVGVEEHMVISVEDDIPAFEKPLVGNTSELNHDTWATPVVHKLEEEKVESFEETLVNINEQFASARIDEPVMDKPVVNLANVVEEKLNVDETTSSNEDPFYGFDFSDVEFIRVDTIEENVVDKFDAQFKAVETKIETPIADITPIQPAAVASIPHVEVSTPQNTLFNVENTPIREPKINKPKSINDIYNTTIVVGLNDRIAFERHLFNGSAEDFNRVLSQLNTVSSFDEAMSLIEHLVKPEYNNWDGKEEYAERFMALVEKRFI